VAIAVATLAVAIPLGITGARVARDTAREYRIRTVAEASLEPQIELTDVRSRGSLIEVTLAGPEALAADIAQRAAERIHEAYPDVTVRVSLLQGQIVEIPPARVPDGT